jgi:hypothetical protein
MSDDRADDPGVVPERLKRIGDAERDRVASALGEHFAAGRLDRSELDTRLEATYAARIRADLERLTMDLPGPSPLAAEAPALRRRARHPGRRIPAPLIPVLAVLLFIAVVHAIPIIAFFVLFWVIRGGRHRAWR